MKTITINIPDDTYNELVRFLHYRKLCDQGIGIDFGVLVVIVNAIDKEWDEVVISRKKDGH